jgi:hypothetical protein
MARANQKPLKITGSGGANAMNELAKEKFKVGDIVRSTKEASEWGAVPGQQTGIITGFATHLACRGYDHYLDYRELVRVRLAGNQRGNAHLWHMDFWERYP